ncbi:UNKNOWN [Stylonychia lemnae]|uniref:Uncharacterized protein n=1 Tax=Stylonychia lemnae TaxID=5949 RepID=A0A078A7Y3_STYLE|nr:UNKNOWN [Stylonychia lemnae]|eukprot:CDW77966.1 UNKNOWN [Stylonychia lemnae]
MGLCCSAAGAQDQEHLSQKRDQKIIQHVEDYTLPHGSLKLSVHNCVLKGPVTADSGWACDGRKIFEKCQGGITDFYQTAGKKKYNCAEHDFDLCFECCQYVYKNEKICEASKQKWSGFWLQGQSKGEMKFEKLLITKNTVFGNGEDSIGTFIISGKVHENNQTLGFRKQYLGKHLVTYTGGISNQGKTVQGDWDIGGSTTGKFELNCQ